jgi:hypothetical protein
MRATGRQSTARSSSASSSSADQLDHSDYDEDETKDKGDTNASSINSDRNGDSDGDSESDTDDQSPSLGRWKPFMTWGDASIKEQDRWSVLDKVLAEQGDDSPFLDAKWDKFASDARTMIRWIEINPPYDALNISASKEHLFTKWLVRPLSMNAPREKSSSAHSALDTRTYDYRIQHMVQRIRAAAASLKVDSKKRLDLEASMRHIKKMYNNARAHYSATRALLFKYIIKYQDVLMAQSTVKKVPLSAEALYAQQTKLQDVEFDRLTTSVAQLTHNSKACIEAGQKTLIANGFPYDGTEDEGKCSDSANKLQDPLFDSYVKSLRESVKLLGSFIERIDVLQATEDDFVVSTRRMKKAKERAESYQTTLTALEYSRGTMLTDIQGMKLDHTDCKPLHPKLRALWSDFLRLDRSLHADLKTNEQTFKALQDKQREEKSTVANRRIPMEFQRVRTKAVKTITSTGGGDDDDDADDEIEYIYIDGDESDDDSDDSGSGSSSSSSSESESESEDDQDDEETNENGGSKDVADKGKTKNKTNNGGNGAGEDEDENEDEDGKKQVDKSHLSLPGSEKLDAKLIADVRADVVKDATANGTNQQVSDRVTALLKAYCRCALFKPILSKSYLKNLSLRTVLSSTVGKFFDVRYSEPAKELVFYLHQNVVDYVVGLPRSEKAAAVSWNGIPVASASINDLLPFIAESMIADAITLVWNHPSNKHKKEQVSAETILKHTFQQYPANGWTVGQQPVTRERMVRALYRAGAVVRYKRQQDVVEAQVLGPKVLDAQTTTVRVVDKTNMKASSLLQSYLAQADAKFAKWKASHKTATRDVVATKQARFRSQARALAEKAEDAAATSVAVNRILSISGGFLAAVSS